MLFLNFLLFIILLNHIVSINLEAEVIIDENNVNDKINQNNNNMDNIITVNRSPKRKRYLKSVIGKEDKNLIGKGGPGDNDDAVFHTLAPTSTNILTLSPTPHSLDHETDYPTMSPTTNPYQPTRSPTDPPDETNGIIVVSTVFGCFLLGVLYFQFIKPNFISKKKVELAERPANLTSSADFDARAPEFDQIYGDSTEEKLPIAHSNSKDSLSLKNTWLNRKSFDEKDPLIPK